MHAISQIILPFDLYAEKNILIRVPAFNTKDSLTLFFDTGAATMVLDNAAAERYQIKADMKQGISGASGTKIYQYATGRTLQLTSSVAIFRVNFVLDDLSRLNATVGRKFDGIIGNDILKNYLTVIDFTNRRLLLYSFNQKLDTKGYTEIGFNFSDGRPIPELPVSIKLLNGDDLSGNVLYDSGAGLTLMVNMPFQQKNDLMRKVGKRVESTQDNLSNKSVTTLAAIGGLKLGPFNFNQKLRINISTDQAGVSAYEGYLGILGAEIINRFDQIIDYNAKRIYLKPNYLNKKNFVTTVPPVKLSLKDNKVIISSIIKDSPAYRSGLREGQTIVSINGRSNTDLQFYKEMMLKENEELEVAYLDANDHINKCRFKIEKLL
ncbi:aspartyl protease family protein [Mucilaginibacter sp. 21P]|uniref:aspartyl protease family protein n=1 Tax=Mucilaginibacter sp. 21P TaxID=2778902 RepID=UPI001C56208B|nr:aspartyl protease family protein [Mucilaginibacter sp. 21P]QXV63800.1 aspartyl protease family protein [Mucilaginibacter sp. 21P]